jgi:hypothetical protein
VTAQDLGRVVAREADPRWSEVAGSQIELVALVDGWTVGPAVPESVADVLSVARSLLIDSYALYAYSLVAVAWGLLAMEASLNGCVPGGERQDRRSLRLLVAEAQRHGLITHDEASALGTAVTLRNRIVHGYLQPKPLGQSYSAKDAVLMLESIHLAISDFYERQRSQNLSSGQAEIPSPR